MTKTQRPDPATIARLIETDELIRYAVEELGGQITAIRDPMVDHGGRQTAERLTQPGNIEKTICCYNTTVRVANAPSAHSLDR